ncbi:MAG: hypothetical protein HeimC2_42740 [Candidatus Heimdallarchaeota archaeon LC_2]|nr:MAG: hypothetical protein HeimC2_42740 [Candidatus Heimdallarchaeota archaeon LC_2]
MKIFLDTCYFLPIIGISNSNLDPNYLLKLLDHKDSHDLLYSTITLFELQAKGAKECEKGNLDPQRILRGIQSLTQGGDFSEIHLSSSSLITQLSMELRKYHTDFIKCLILATAIVSADILVSEDRWINGFVDTNDYSNLVDTYQLSKNFGVSRSRKFIL